MIARTFKRLACRIIGHDDVPVLTASGYQWAQWTKREQCVRCQRMTTGHLLPWRPLGKPQTGPAAL